MATVEVNEPLLAASDNESEQVAAAEVDDVPDRLPELVAALVIYGNRVERLHARMSFSADQGDRMMEQLALAPLR